MVHSASCSVIVKDNILALDGMLTNLVLLVLAYALRYRTSFLVAVHPIIPPPKDKPSRQLLHEASDQPYTSLHPSLIINTVAYQESFALLSLAMSCFIHQSLCL